MANEDDVKIALSESTKSGSSVTGLAYATVPRYRNVSLHERCSMLDMTHLKSAFDSANRLKMRAGEFRELLKTRLSVEYDDDEYNLLFLKINTSRTGEIDWDELVSHLLLGYNFANDAEKQRQALQPPIIGLPVIMRSEHRHPISRICFCPDVDKICTMYYYFHKDDVEQCKLICGDVGGNVRVLLFSAHMRGPFQNDAGRPLKTVRHVDLQKRPHVLPGLRLLDLVRLHPDWVRQVSYYAPLHCVMSCATCYDSLLLCDLKSSKAYYMFRVDKGIQCFAFDEEAHLLVTGGPDCTVRVWNPFVPAKANVVLKGHHAVITCIVLQNKGRTIYSLSRDRTIKVWDLQSQACRQTYIDIPAILGEHTPISAVYNPATRDFILASVKIAIIVLDEQLNPLHTDGFTHASAVSKVLYNPLFKVIITCGADSIIINWNPVTGKRNVLIRDAHVRHIHGELVPVEITAACFDPGYQLLLTGARNGELKVIVQIRILAVGWNRHVIEFDDTGMATTGKCWETRHTDDVLAAAARPPITLATSTYNSELVMWKMETGQPYRQFSCTEPNLRIKMVYNRHETPLCSKSDNKWSNFRKPNALVGGSRGNVLLTSHAIKKATERRAELSRARPEIVAEPSCAQNERHLAVHAMIFLCTRPQHMSVACLLLALDNGQIQCWSDHSAGGYQGSFQVVHTPGDYAVCLATDKNNEFLFAGTTLGYVKVWLMSNYLINDLIHVNMPRLRLMFPFLWRDRIEGRAKRCVRNQPKPLLLNSYRAHLRCITSIVYIDEDKLVLTGSSDYSVRVWRLSGEYLQTLGSFLPWTLEVTRFPPDVKKVASFTTFKVWRSGYVSRYVPGQKEVDKLRDITDHELKTKTYGAAPDEPLLGNYFSLPRRPDQLEPILLNDSLPTIPIYAHLRMASTQPVRRPPTPELVCELRLKQSVLQSKKAHFDSEAPLQRQSAHGQATQGRALQEQSAQRQSLLAKTQHRHRTREAR
ncbi:hypothetical protein HF086_007215 [Spodoptera exigua]|uniref:WD repeat-containing protein on Y chromosome n=1 Tax=Spodoptera exigua TaxID=7107 RepID=A0A922SLE2_SPOEX|nr:hypothetical protein HF086_007215 [Spodoptera exigua]